MQETNSTLQPRVNGSDDYDSFPSRSPVEPQSLQSSEKVIRLENGFERYNHLIAIEPSTKLSKLQKFILIEAAKALPTLEETARGLNAFRAPFTKPDTEPITPKDIPHVTRNEILIGFFSFPMRKKRFGGWVTDWDTDRIDAESDPDRYNRANAALYRAVRRLEMRGLIRRMSERRSGMQLTEKGIAVAKSLTCNAETNHLAKIKPITP
jgi:hypothetical protein